MKKQFKILIAILIVFLVFLSLSKYSILDIKTFFLPSPVVQKSRSDLFVRSVKPYQIKQNISLPVIPRSLPIDTHQVEGQGQYIALSKDKSRYLILNKNGSNNTAGLYSSGGEMINKFQMMTSGNVLAISLDYEGNSLCVLTKAPADTITDLYKVQILNTKNADEIYTTSSLCINKFGISTRPIYAGFLGNSEIGIFEECVTPKGKKIRDGFEYSYLLKCFNPTVNTIQLAAISSKQLNDLSPSAGAKSIRIVNTAFKFNKELVLGLETIGKSEVDQRTYKYDLKRANFELLSSKYSTFIVDESANGKIVTVNSLKQLINLPDENVLLDNFAVATVSAFDSVNNKVYYAGSPTGEATWDPNMGLLKPMKFFVLKLPS